METSEEHGRRLDRELNELLQELRVVQGGILLLIGFLLVIAFSPGFVTVNAFQKWVYYLTLMVTGLSAIVIVAPVVHHRMAFRKRDKEAIVVRGNAMVLIAIGLVALSILGIGVLVSHVVFGTMVTIVMVIAYLVVVTWCWWVMPKRSIKAAAAAGEQF